MFFILLNLVAANCINFFHIISNCVCNFELVILNCELLILSCVKLVSKKNVVGNFKKQKNWIRFTVFSIFDHVFNFVVSYWFCASSANIKTVPGLTRTVQLCCPSFIWFVQAKGVRAYFHNVFMAVLFWFCLTHSYKFSGSLYLPKQLPILLLIDMTFALIECILWELCILHHFYAYIFQGLEIMSNGWKWNWH